MRDQRRCHQNGGAKVDDFQSIGSAHQQHLELKEANLPVGQRAGLHQSHSLVGKPQRQE